VLLVLVIGGTGYLYGGIFGAIVSSCCTTWSPPGRRSTGILARPFPGRPGAGRPRAPDPAGELVPRARRRREPAGRGPSGHAGGGHATEPQREPAGDRERAPQPAEADGSRRAVPRHGAIVFETRSVKRFGRASRRRSDVSLSREGRPPRPHRPERRRQDDAHQPADRRARAELAVRSLLDGTDITRLGAHHRVRRGVVRTFQINQLFSELTPLQSLALSVSVHLGLSARWWRPLGSDRASPPNARPAAAVPPSAT
jgi:hypothetical protein